MIPSKPPRAQGGAKPSVSTPCFPRTGVPPQLAPVPRLRPSHPTLPDSAPPSREYFRSPAPEAASLSRGAVRLRRGAPRKQSLGGAVAVQVAAGTYSSGHHRTSRGSHFPGKGLWLTLLPGHVQAGEGRKWLQSHLVAGRSQGGSSRCFRVSF